MAKSNPRRAIIREWRSLARETRQSIQQACGRRPAAPPSASQQTTAARCHHGMAADAHRTALRTTQRMNQRVSTILSAIFAIVRREVPLGPALNQSRSVHCLVLAHH